MFRLEPRTPRSLHPVQRKMVEQLFRTMLFSTPKGTCPTTDRREIYKAFRLVLSSRLKRGERNWLDSRNTCNFILRTRRFLEEIILFLSSLLSSSFNATNRVNNGLNVEKRIP